MSEWNEMRNEFIKAPKMQMQLTMMINDYDVVYDNRCPVSFLNQ